MKRSHLFALSALSLLSIVGCAMTPISNTGVVPPDGVIYLPPEEDALIEKADFSPDTYIYRHPRRSPLDFAQIIVSSVSVYDNMSSEIKKRDRRYLDEVGDSFQKRMLRLIERDYLPAQVPNELTLRIDIELVALKPGMRLFKDRRERVKMPDSEMVGTKLEADCYDSVTNELIFAVSTFYKGEEYKAFEKPALITNIRGAFGEWSEHFKKRFDDVMTFKKN